MTSFVADIRDLERLTGDPYQPFKDACYAGTAQVRRAREVVEQHWYDLPPEGQEAARRLALSVRHFPESLGEMSLARRISLAANAAWTFITKPNRGGVEAALFATELVRFALVVEAQVQDQERRHLWLVENAAIDENASADAERGEGEVFSLDKLRARVTEKI